MSTMTKWVMQHPVLETIGVQETQARSALSAAEVPGTATPWEIEVLTDALNECTGRLQLANFPENRKALERFDASLNAYQGKLQEAEELYTACRMARRAIPAFARNVLKVRVLSPTKWGEAVSNEVTEGDE